MPGPDALIRPPRQRRSQEALERLLDGGFAVLKEQGFEGFTLQEVSKRTGVSIGSIYARVPNREALIIAIYERAMGWVIEEDNRQVELAKSLDGRPPREIVESLVAAEIRAMLEHADILRVFMRQAPYNPEIWERGALKSQQTGTIFKEALLSVIRDHVDHPDPELAVDVAWRMFYCTVSRRITHGPRFESRRVLSEQQFVTELSRAVAKQLL